ncbi:MAG: ABC transporter permease [Fibrobacteraceae bacterium]|jgi:lipopolysaccharide transport system permease protein|nr:ABC transporter permease [Fibrobacteraceae bacterium]
MQSKWTTVIQPKNSLLQVDFRELWQYRDLYRMLVKRDIVVWYKQTILGPLWFFIQPILTTIMFMIVFGGIAKIGTDGIPQPLFYLAGICLWNYFAESLNQTSNTFIQNSALFGKVYFPRLVVPFATVTSNLVRLGIQLLLFVFVYLYFAFFTEATVAPNLYICLVPLLILLLSGLALGFGVLFSSLTTKYRDLTFLLSFLVQLWMYATPVIYPLSTIENPTLKTLMLLNPMTAILETFKYAMLGVGQFRFEYLTYSALFTLFIMAIGIVVFNKVQRTFMDTV